MTHGLQDSIPVLRRWATVSDLPLPTDWNQFKSKNATDALLIEQKDPELVSLLNNTAPANLRADALSGDLKQSAPDPVQRQEQQRRAEVQDLFDRRAELTFTERLHLQALDSRVFEKAFGAEAEESVADQMQARIAEQVRRAENAAASRNHQMNLINGAAK